MKMRRKKLLFVALLIGMGISPAISFSQIVSADARSMALAGAYSALARGADVTRWNPANLGLVNSPNFSLQLPAIGVGLYNSSFGLSDYNRYNGAQLTESDKQDILQKIPADGLKLFLNSRANFFALSIYRIALAVTARVASDFALAKEFSDLLLNGNQFGRTYDFSQTKGSAWAMADFAISYGQPLYVPLFQDFSLGATFHWIKGLGYGEVLSASGKFTTDFSGIYGDGQAKLRTALGGSGLALDLGAAAIVNNRWTLSLGFKNVIGNIRWTRDIKIYTFGVQTDTLTVEYIANTDADSLTDSYSQEMTGEAFRSRLPLQLNFGAAFSTRAFQFAAEYAQSFQSAPGISNAPELSIGTEYKGLGFLPLRVGIALGGTNKFMTALGAGLKFGGFSLDFAMQSYKALVPGSGPGIGLGFDIKIGN